LDLIDHINRDFDSAVDKYCAARGTGKKLKKGRMPRNVILLADDVPILKGSKCDCLIFIKEKASQRVFVIITELKSKHWDPSEVFKKISGCYDFIKNLLKKYNVPIKQVKFTLVLYAERFRTSSVEQLASFSIERHKIKKHKYDVSLEKLIARMQ
jgi:hypothetical protein